jgi:hypothetical protein
MESTLHEFLRLFDALVGWCTPAEMARFACDMTAQEFHALTRGAFDLGFIQKHGAFVIDNLSTTMDVYKSILFLDSVVQLSGIGVACVVNAFQGTFAINKTRYKKALDAAKKRGRERAGETAAASVASSGALKGPAIGRSNGGTAGNTDKYATPLPPALETTRAGAGGAKAPTTTPSGGEGGGDAVVGSRKRGREETKDSEDAMDDDESGAGHGAVKCREPTALHEECKAMQVHSPISRKCITTDEALFRITKRPCVGIDRQQHRAILSRR